MSDHLGDILLDHDWRGNTWRTETSGDGAATDSSGILTTTGTTGQAQRSFWVPVGPGVEIEVEVLGRQVSGTVGVYLHLVNNTGTGFEAAKVLLSGNDWKTYRVNYIVPMSQSSDTMFVLVRFGVASGSAAGDGRFQWPVIRLGRGYGMPIMIAEGLIQQAGSPSLVTSRSNHGIASLAFNGTDTVTVTLTRAIPVNGPIGIIQLTGNKGQPARIPVVGTVTGGTSPTIEIQWTNGTAIQTVSSGTTFAYMTVWL